MRQHVARFRFPECDHLAECRRAAGKPLVENAEIDKIADVLYEAPFAILAHNRFAPNVPDEEAVYTYGNKARPLQNH